MTKALPVNFSVRSSSWIVCNDVGRPSPALIGLAWKGAYSKGRGGRHGVKCERVFETKDECLGNLGLRVIWISRLGCCYSCQ